jgi:heme exporter protein B
VFGLFYNIRWVGSFLPLFLVIALATWGITVVGTAFSAVTVNVRLRELILPVLHYPVLIPLLIGAMELTTGLLNGNAVMSDIRLLIVFDVIYTSLAIMLIEFILVI